MALNRSDKSRILRRYFPGMTRNSEMSTEPNPFRYCRCGSSSSEISCKYSNLAGNSLGKFKLASPM